MKFDGEGRPTFHVGWLFLLSLAYATWHMQEFSDVLCQTAALFAVSTAIAAFDAKYYIIPDFYQASLLIGGLSTIDYSEGGQVIDRLLAALFGFSFIYLLNAGYRAIRGCSGIGLGDAKLLAASAVWIGLRGLPTEVLWASLSGCVAVIILRIAKKDIGRVTAIPFGPHLALGIWLTWIFGPLTINSP